MNLFRPRPPQAAASRGFSLVELMIAIVLGMLVVGSAFAIFMSNRQTYAATESLGRTQENARLAFELMARDLREAGSTPCGNSRRTVGSVLNPDPTAAGWYAWGDALTGYDGGVALPGVAFGTATADRIAGTDAIEVRSGTAGGVKYASHNAGSATSGSFTMVTASHGFRVGDVLVACDYARGAVFQVTGVSGAKITYATGSGSPGNATASLGGCAEAECTPGLYTFQPNGLITRLGASRWYIGANDRGGRSLFQQTVTSGVGSPPQEIAEGVDNLDITYLLNTNPDYYKNRVIAPATQYVATVGADEWTRVLAVRMDLTLTGPDKVEGNTITRQLTHTVDVRNQNI